MPVIATKRSLFDFTAGTFCNHLKLWRALKVVVASNKVQVASLSERDRATARSKGGILTNDLCTLKQASECLTTLPLTVFT